MIYKEFDKTKRKHQLLFLLIRGNEMTTLFTQTFCSPFSSIKNRSKILYLPPLFIRDKMYVLTFYLNAFSHRLD